MAWEVLREEPSHFVVHTGAAEVKIAKKALSPGRREQYQALCKGGEVAGESVKGAKAFAKGGEVEAAPKAKAKPAGLDLSKHKLAEETDAHWHIDGPGGRFKVAKKGIGKGLADRIAQHFADGGEAEAPVISEDPAVDAALAAQSAEAAQTDPLASRTPTVREMAEASRPPTSTDVPGPAYDPASDPQQDPTIGTATPDPRGLTPLNVSQTQLDAAFPATAQGAPASLPAAAPAATAGAPAPTSPPDTAPGVQRELASAYKNAQAAEQAKADVTKREANVALVMQLQNERDRQKLSDSWQAAWKKWQDRGDELRQDILDPKNKIDANRYWTEKGTGGRISAAIGLILGGIGSGLTRQPNAALQVIESAIGRDLDAQKAELGKKETLLGFHMQQGHALQASYQLAKADMLDAAAAKLQMTSTRFAGDKAQAAASGAIASLQAAAATTRQQVAAAGLQMQLHGVQLQQANMGLAMSQLQMGALSALTSGQAAAPGARGAGLGVRLDPRAIEFLPDHMRERLVTLPDGSYALGRTAKAAEETSKSFEGAAILREKLGRYRALLDEHPHGVSSTLSPKDYDTAQALRDSILTDINGLAGLNRFTSEEAKVYAGRVPDVTAKQLRATGHQAKLEELGREIDEKVLGVSRQYLDLARQPRAPGAR